MKQALKGGARHPRRWWLRHLVRSAGRDDIAPFAFLFGFLLAACMAAVVPVVLGSRGDLGSILFWISGVMLIGASLGVGYYLYRLYHRIFAGDPAVLLVALDQAPEASIITDLDGEPIFANTAYRLITLAVDNDVPAPAKLALGRPAAETIFAQAHAAALEGRDKTQSLVLTTPDGETRRIELSVQRAGKFRSFLTWQLRDVTAREADLRIVSKGSQLLAPTLDQVNCGMMVVDSDGIIIDINETFSNWLDTKVSAVAGHLELKNFVDSAKLKGNGKAVPRLPKEGDFCFLTSKGRSLPLQIYTGGFEGTPDSIVSHRIIIARNPQDTAGQASAFGTSDIHLEKFFQDAPVGIAVVDAAGTIYESNLIFQNLMPDYNEDRTHNLREMLPPEFLRDVLEHLSSTLKKAEKVPVLDVHFKKDPSATGQLYIHPVEGGADDNRAVLYLVDTTEQKNLEMQFAQSQKMQAVGQLAGGIAHDFNNLLTAITGFSDLLLVRHGPGDQSFEDIMQIKQNANRAANLVRQLLAFSRQQTLRPKVLVVTDVLAELSNLLRRLIGENIELKMIHGRDLGPVKVDQGQLEQVIINLAVNARDAMAEGGTVTIRTANVTIEESKKLGHEIMPPSNYVLIEVCDTGMGIPSENIGKIFEPFFSTKEVGKGTGLGLSTVYGIVKQTGGFIFPVSKLGEGAIFRIYLPIYETVANEEESSRGQKADNVRDLTGKGTILLVEDEDAVRMFASRALRNKGYIVHEASSGESALSIVDQNQKIDLLISDVVMPQMDGPSLVKEIRQRRDSMKIIFISGYAEDAFRKNLVKGEVFSFLPKPFSLKQLAEKVKEVLEKDQAA